MSADGRTQANNPRALVWNWISSELPGESSPWIPRRILEEPRGARRSYSQEKGRAKRGGRIRRSQEEPKEEPGGARGKTSQGLRGPCCFISSPYYVKGFRLPASTARGSRAPLAQMGPISPQGHGDEFQTHLGGLGVQGGGKPTGTSPQGSRRQI